MTTESSVRRKALRRGFFIHKSRARKHVPHGYNYGRYMLLNSRTSFVVLGERFDATLGDIEFFLNETDRREADELRMWWAAHCEAALRNKFLSGGGVI
jgi:hypothetical protein